MSVIDILIDFETAGGGNHNRNKSSVLELGAVSFVNDPEIIPNFEEIKSNGLRVKFDIKSQSANRIIDTSTIHWWRTQSIEAQEVLRPSPEDVSIKVGVAKFLVWLNKQNITKDSQIWCRGMDFDFPILHNIIEEASTKFTEKYADIGPSFWKGRDVRTRIEAMLGRDMTECPLPLGTLPNFVAHSGLDDCAKDVMMIIYASRYAFEMEEPPTLENSEPATTPKKR